MATIGTEGAVAQHAWLRPQVLDRAEQVVVTTLWVFLAWRVIGSTNPFALLLLLSETAVAVFVLIRRSTSNISMELGDWLLAFTATIAPLLIMPVPNMFPQLVPFGVTLIALGNVWQVGAKLILRRSFGIAPANRGVKISGPYRFMRHPMYAGYLWAHIGILVLMFSPLNLLIYMIGWWAQIRRIMAEERLLSQDPAYREYMARVRYRLVPGVF